MIWRRKVINPLKVIALRKQGFSYRIIGMLLSISENRKVLFGASACQMAEKEYS